MAYATASDVEDRLGRELDSSETQIVNTRLDDVERLIKARIKDLDDLVDAGEPDEDLVVQIEAEAVLRLIRNPEGLTSETDGNYTYMISSRVASGRLEILDTEWALLGVRRSVFVIAPKVDIPWHTPGVSYDHDPEPAVWG